MPSDREADFLSWTGERYLPGITGDIRLEHLHRYLLARELSHGKIVLDIACGEGYGADLLATVAAQVIGVDAAPDAIDHAMRRYRRPNLTFRGGSCAAIPLLDASVDVVVSFETIEHHNRHEQMLSEVRRVLRPGGLLIMSSPDRHEYSDARGQRNPFHVCELSRDEFERLVRARFTHVRLVGQRMRSGSIVAPLDGDAGTRFLTFSDADGQVESNQGLLGAMYLVAMASDAPLPVIPVGIMETAEVAEAVSPPPPVAGHDPAAPGAASTAGERIAALERAGERQRRQIGDLESLVARLQQAREQHRTQSLASWAQSLEDRTRLVDLGREVAGHRLRLQAAERLATDARQQAETRAATIADLSRSILRVEADRGAVETTLAQERSASQAMEAHLRVVIGRLASELNGTVTAMRRSRSWRITRPLRAARAALAAVRRRVWRVEAPSADLMIDAPADGDLPAADRPPPPHVVASPCHPESVARPAVAADLATAEASEDRAVLAPVPASNDVALAWVGGDASPDYVGLAHGAPVTSSIKAIAFYLPQFHPIPENDAWWGRGFTEWANVTRGRPRFEGHYQPHLPGDLGFYDLRVPAVQRRQAELARQYGIHGFCYYHYWFSGRRLLRAPLDQMLADADLDFPFCVCWANENWTRRWDGHEQEVLMAQQHSPADDDAFIEDLEPVLRDPRYIRVEGKPLVIVYRPALLPDAADTARRWRAHCGRSGLDLFLVSTHAFDRRDPRELGFDAALEFAPNNIDVPAALDVHGLDPSFSGTVRDYRALVERSRAMGAAADYPLFRSVMPAWDNESRRQGRGTVYAHSTPSLYREWLTAVCRDTERRLPPSMPFVFINAWNEWAEGAHLEPDRRFGYAYLQATGDALAACTPSAQTERPGIIVVSHDAHFHGAQLLALHLVRSLATTFRMRVEVLLCGGGALTAQFADVASVHDFSAAGAAGDRAAIARRLHRQGVRIALCNTCVVGEAVEILKREGFTVVSLVHELPGVIESMKLDGSVARLAQYADHVVFPAEVVRTPFLRMTTLDPRRTSVRPQGLFAPNPFAGDRQPEARRALRDRLGLAQDTRVILGAGYADQRKGIDLFVRAGCAALAEANDLVCVWLGASEPVAFEAALATIAPPLRSRFLFLPAVPDFEVFFAGADVFLMTSREDPFPTVVLHALDAGIPVIGFEDAGGFVELLARGYGILVPHLDTDAMAAASLRILNEPGERHRLVDAGAEVIAREFAFTDYVRWLLERVQPPAPRVSVIVPNCDYARYLPERLRSITSQTLPPHEILFLDDCSTDDSVAIARAHLHASGLPYRIIRQETRQGTYRQWLRGLREATGDFVWIAEADDACEATFLQTLSRALARDDVVLAYCQSRQVDDAGRQLAPDYLEYTRGISPTKWLEPYVRRGLDEIRDTLFVKNTIPSASAVVLRTPDLSAIEAELSRMRYAGDWLVYVTALARGSIAFVPDALNRHRRHARSAIANAGEPLLKEILAVQQHVLRCHAVTPEVMRLRDREFQDVYEQLGLAARGPRAASDHPELGVLTWAET